jgi:hypothetical protein
VEDIALTAGLRVHQNNFATPSKYPFETMGGAVAALDFNNDGLLDLLFLNGAPSPEHRKTGPDSINRLFKNSGKLTFVDASAGSGLSALPKQRDGSFQNVTAKAGVVPSTPLQGQRLLAGLR